MEILRAKPEDAASLSEIAFAAKRHWGYPDRWIQSWRDILTIRPEFMAGNEIYMAHVDRQVVGFYCLARQSSRMSLEHLWVLPKYMGKGFGQALFNHAVERARALGFESIIIESDPNAEGFYKRMGARSVGANVSELDDERRVLPVLIMNCSRNENPTRPDAD